VSDAPIDRERVWVVVPAYNEARVIGGVVQTLVNRGYPVVVIDDGSADHTEAAAAQTGAVVLRHVINRGTGAAIQTGVDYALRCAADYIVTFDADGQHDPSDIDALVAPIASGDYDVVFGSRFLGTHSNMPAGRRLVLWLGMIFTRVVSRVRITDPHIGLRAFSRRAAGELALTMDRFAHASEIVDRIRERKWRFHEIPVSVSYSAYSLAKGQRSGNAFHIAAQVLLRRLT
jgi:glycosyltransferase involved in cell wall biosynthesis